MADEKKQIVLQIKIEETQAKDRLKEITALLASQTKAQSELAAQIRKAGKATDEQAAQMVAYKSHISSLSREQNALYKNLALYEKQQESASGSYDQLSAAASILKKKLNELEGTLQKNADGTFTLTQEYLDAKVASENANKALIEFDLGVKSGGRNVGNYANSIAGLEEQLKDLNAKLRETDANSPEFEETKKAVDDTTVKLGILSGKYDEFGNREPKNPQKAEMDALSDATAGAISAFEVLNVLQSDNESLAEAQAASLRAIAIAQNLRNIQIGIANAGEAAGVIISKASTLATNAKTKAVGLATVATRVWNTVLRLNPIGLVITAVLAAVAAVTFLTNKFNLAAKAGAFFNEHFSGVVKWLLKTGEALGLVDTATEKALKTMEKRKAAAEDEIKVLEASEGREREIYERRQKLMSQELQLLGRLKEEKGKLSDDEKKRQSDLLTELKILNIEEKKRLEKAQEDADKAAKDKAKKAADEARKALQEAEKRTKELLEISKERIERELGHAEEGSIKQLNLRQALIRKQLEIDNVGAELSRARRVANQEKANDEILKVNEEYFKNMEIQHRSFAEKVLGPITKDEVAKQIEALGQRLDAQKRLNEGIADAEIELQQTKMDAMSAGVDALKGFFGEQNAISQAFFLTQKGLAIADIIMNLQTEIAKIASANASLGPVGVPLTVTQSLAAKIRAGIGIGTIAAQAIQQFTMAEGGVVQGPSHAGGGVRGTGNFANVEVEGGEAVINKESTARYKSLLSAINVAGGGRPLTPSRFNAAGGIVPPVPVPYDHFAAAARYSIANGNPSDMAKMIGNEVARQMENMPRPIVSVTDFHRVENKVEVKRTKTDI